MEGLIVMVLLACFGPPYLLWVYKVNMEDQSEAEGFRAAAKLAIVNVLLQVLGIIIAWLASQNLTEMGLYFARGLLALGFLEATVFLYLPSRFLLQD